MIDRCRAVRQLPLPTSLAALVLAGLLILGPPSWASSHREAPSLLSQPQVDGTDFYMFRSYEQGRENFVTLIANYNPLQDPYGGPNYFPLDDDAFYDIHISNDGDAVEDLTFRFKTLRRSPFLALEVGDPGATESVPVSLVNIGSFGAGIGKAGVNEQRSYTLRLIRGSLNAPESTTFAADPATGSMRLPIPLDNIGEKSIPAYARYSKAFIRDLEVPGCGAVKVFVGQRRESFAVNLGEVFDLVNTNPVGPPDAERSVTEDKNITSLALEVPVSCLNGDSDVIAGWTTARLPRQRTLSSTPTYERPDQHQGEYVQVSRLGNPLVNEVAIGLPDKNLFNASHPANDGQFLRYVTHPTLPELLQVLFGVRAPDLFPRDDLVQIFLTGVPGLNQDGSVGEMMRLNTAIAPLPAAEQNPLGVIGGDAAGYPNGRRPGDDTVDISLRAMRGILLAPAVAPAGDLPYTDGFHSQVP